MTGEFVPRSELTQYEWDETTKKWQRPPIDRETLRQLTHKSTADGMLRVTVQTLCIFASGWLAVFVSRYHLLFAVVPFLVFAFLIGFLSGIEHEMRHRIIFSKRWEWFSNGVYILIHILFKEGSEHQTLSHRIHHRYTMVTNVDPETEYPEIITRRWVWKTLLTLLFDVITLGIPSFFKGVWTLIMRTAGRLRPRIEAHATPSDKKRIRLESFLILLINLAALAVFIVYCQWHLIFLLILAPRMGLAIVSFWFLTEHIGMMNNSNDQRLCTRGVKVSRIVRFFYGGLDEHVEHHLFPAVPSRNLTKLRETLSWKIPERENVIKCWREILAIARHKETNPEDVLIPRV